MVGLTLDEAGDGKAKIARVTQMSMQQDTERDGEARSCPGADLVSICRGSWALLSLLLWCGDWFFPKVELCDFEGDPK